MSARELGARTALHLWSRRLQSHIAGTSGNGEKLNRNSGRKRRTDDFKMGARQEHARLSNPPRGIWLVRQTFEKQPTTGKEKKRPTCVFFWKLVVRRQVQQELQQQNDCEVTLFLSQERSVSSTSHSWWAAGELSHRRWYSTTGNVRVDVFVIGEVLMCHVNERITRQGTNHIPNRTEQR